MSIEPHWGGPDQARAPEPDWGDYRLSLYDRGESKALFRTGFDSSVGDGRASTAEISVRFPMPHREVRAAIERRRAGGVFIEKWTGPIDPAHYRSDGSEIKRAIRIDTLLLNGPAEQKVDVAILADGYQQGDYPKFARDAARAVDYLFSVPPFSKRARDFNIRALFAASEDSGVTDPYLGVQRNTVLRSAYGSAEAERTLAVQDNRALREVAAVVPYDFILVLANTRRYGGSALFGGPAVVAIDSAAARYLVLHEFAHIIGGLADEYYVPDAGGPVFTGNVEPWNPNVAISRASGKWRHLSQEPTLGPTAWNKAEYDSSFARYVKRYAALRSVGADEADVEKLMSAGGARAAALLAKNANRGQVGFFEGANGYARGVFRAEVDCIMFSYQTKYFCSACSSAIERMIESHCL